MLRKFKQKKIKIRQQQKRANNLKTKTGNIENMAGKLKE